MVKKIKKLEKKKHQKTLHEDDIQRIVLIGTIAVVVLVLGVLGYAILNENVLKPNKILVTVEDQDISVKDFQEYARFSYALNYGSYPPDQLVQLGVGFEATQFSQDAFNSMVEDIIIEKKAAELGIDITRADAEEWIQLAIGFDAGDPELTPTVTLVPSPTLNPTATATFVFTPTIPPTATLAPDVTQTVEPTLTATPAVVPTETAIPTPEPTAAPLTEEEFTQTFADQVAEVAGIIGLPEGRVKELWIDSVYFYLLRQEMIDQVELEYDTTKVMVHASHILIKPVYETDATDEEIEAAFAEALTTLEAAQTRISEGEDFAVVAAEVSQDTSAYKGGDLGWSTPDRYVAEFADAVSTQVVGVVGQPVRSSFGWHLIKVDDRKVVDLSQAELDAAKQTAFDALVLQWVADEAVDIGVEWINYVPNFPK